LSKINTEGYFLLKKKVKKEWLYYLMYEKTKEENIDGRIIERRRSSDFT